MNGLIVCFLGLLNILSSVVPVLHETFHVHNCVTLMIVCAFISLLSSNTPSYYIGK